MWLWGFYISKEKKRVWALLFLMFLHFDVLSEASEDQFVLEPQNDEACMLSGTQTGGADGSPHSIRLQGNATMSVFISLEQKSDICLHLTYSEACFFMIRAQLTGIE